MENMQQLLVLTDDQGNPINTATRDVCHRGKGLRHWGFILLVKNSEGKYIICKRADTKSCGAGLWDASVVSHVLPGETPLSGAMRRSKEELGISVSNIEDIGGFTYEASYGEYCENEYCTVLIGFSDKLSNPNPEEISEIRLLTLEQLRNDIKRDKSNYAPWLSIPLKKLLIK